jgi:hypothetical protein
MHHKRKRSKKQRAGCLLCKPHKMNGVRNSKNDQNMRARDKKQLDRDLQKLEEVDDSEATGY